MRPGNPNKRLRGRNRSSGGGGGKGPNPLTRSYESNGPDVKIRGTALHIAEKYVQLARDAQSSGDIVMAENYYQHAEHYYRIIAAAQAQSPHPVSFVRDDIDQDEEFETAPGRPDYSQLQPRNGTPYGEAGSHGRPEHREHREHRPYNGNGSAGANGQPAFTAPGLGPQPDLAPPAPAPAPVPAPSAAEAVAQEPAAAAAPESAAAEAASEESSTPRRRRSRGSRGRGRRHDGSQGEDGAELPLEAGEQPAEG
jgi:hypothetical protein